MCLMLKHVKREHFSQLRSKILKHNANALLTQLNLLFWRVLWTKGIHAFIFVNLSGSRHYLTLCLKATWVFSTLLVVFQLLLCACIWQVKVDDLGGLFPPGWFYNSMLHKYSHIFFPHFSFNEVLKPSFICISKSSATGALSWFLKPLTTT